MFVNYWTERSIEFAQKQDYLDKLYTIYPITPNLRRQMPAETEAKIREAFKQKEDLVLIQELLDWDLFPIKDSYVAYLRKDKSAMSRNPQTISRIANILYTMGIEEIITKCTEPKETNRQMGSMFKKWIDTESLDIPVLQDAKQFLVSKDNCIFSASDEKLKDFAQEYLGYERDKGLDFIAKFNDKYILAEAKFITAIGGNQLNQFDDAMSTLQASFENKKVSNEVIPIAIIDGVVYIKSNTKLYRHIENNSDHVIISALLLKEFLYSL
jgi:hypothetical protein